jgi:hypothetical protein
MFCDLIEALIGDAKPDLGVPSASSGVLGETHRFPPPTSCRNAACDLDEVPQRIAEAMGMVWRPRGARRAFVGRSEALAPPSQLAVEAQAKT